MSNGIPPASGYINYDFDPGFDPGSFVKIKKEIKTKK
jgi:hypothetical protein